MSLKRRFILTVILMVVIPALVLALLAAVLLTSAYVGYEQGDQPLPDIVQVNRRALLAELRPGGRMFGLMLIWGVSAVACTGASFAVGTFYLSRRLLVPLRELRRTVADISAGNLDDEVLSADIEEVDELCSAIDELRIRLKRSVNEQVQLERERSLMLASLSHDLRTPVTAIKGYADGLREGVASTPEMQARYISTIYSRASDMERMIEQASDFSELELGRMRFDFETYDGVDELRRICDDFRTDFEAAGAELVFADGSGSALISGDRYKLRRIFANLFSNAVKYRSPARPLRVNVTTSLVGGNLRAVVRDNGSGIPAEAASRVFEGFYRADPARRTSGHGLGLAICRQIIERHGGRITIQSTPGEWTEVSVQLPVAGDGIPTGEKGALV